jgi:hypothetical protein
MTKYTDLPMFWNQGMSPASQANALNQANDYANALQNSYANALQNVYQKPISKLDHARGRFGKPFAADKGSTWVPRTKPVLTEWLESREKK